MKMVKVASTHRTMLIGLAVALVIVGTLLSVAMAQPGPQEGDQGDQGGRRGGDRGDMRAMMRAAPTPAIAVSGDAVFLFVGNTLYKFNANTLELLAQTQLPRAERPAAPAEQ